MDMIIRKKILRMINAAIDIAKHVSESKVDNVSVFRVMSTIIVYVSTDTF